MKKLLNAGHPELKDLNFFWIRALRNDDDDDDDIEPFRPGGSPSRVLISSWLRARMSTMLGPVMDWKPPTTPGEPLALNAMARKLSSGMFTSQVCSGLVGSSWRETKNMLNRNKTFPCLRSFIPELANY